MKDEMPDTVHIPIPQAYAAAAERHRRDLFARRKKALEDARVVAMELFSEFVPGERGVAMAIEAADRITEAILGASSDDPSSEAR